MHDKGQYKQRAQYQFAEGVNLGKKTGPSPLRSVMVQEVDGR